MQLLKAALSQLLALAGVWLALRGWPGVFDPRWAPLLQAAGAALLSRLLRQPLWWLPIHLSFFPAVLFAISLQLPAWAYLGAGLLMALVFWGTVGGDVPLFLSSPAVAAALQQIAVQERAESFIDLGAGVASVAAPLAAAMPDLQITALERAPLPYLLARWRCRNLTNAVVAGGSFWDCDLGRFDLVFAFLSPAVMPRLGRKLAREMRAGSLFVSSSFPLPGWPLSAEIRLADRRGTRLYCYRIGDQRCQANAGLPG
ncbi:hypothetical protein A1507_13940 [Methylomonas koyamae]|uniref:Methyltransferase type 12 n=1 Tax=Methylomonas koyamae TaxID=702114 RepID=A0A177NC99_9GAMM|nr:hypothetical protein [Methylomonas koyamae]OAI15525.1 hypothetical protein A1507_13940 [Methylomonas koyamae]